MIQNLSSQLVTDKRRKCILFGKMQLPRDKVLQFGPNFEMDLLCLCKGAKRC